MWSPSASMDRGATPASASLLRLPTWSGRWNRPANRAGVTGWNVQRYKGGVRRRLPASAILLAATLAGCSGVATTPTPTATPARATATNPPSQTTCPSPIPALASPAASFGNAEFPVPTSTAILDIAVGPDGSAWFTEQTANQIGRVTAEGKVVEYSVGRNGPPRAITRGADGAMWFTEDAGYIGRIGPDGAISEYPLPSPGRPWGIATGPDGNVWFTDQATSQVGKVTPCGVVTEYRVSGPPSSITPAADGNMWFSIPSIRIGRITPAGAIHEFPVDVPAEYLVGTPDGNVWFLSDGIAAFPPEGGSFSPTGLASGYPVAGPPRSLAGLTLGGGVTLWFSDGKLSRVGRLSLDGTITEYALPWGDVTPSSLASGPDGSLWIVDAGGSRIVHLIPPA